MMSNRRGGVKIQSTVFCDQAYRLPQVTIKRHFTTVSKPINSSVSGTIRSNSSSSKCAIGSSVTVPPMILPNYIERTSPTNRMNVEILPGNKNKTIRKSSSKEKVRVEPRKSSSCSSLKTSITKQTEKGIQRQATDEVSHLKKSKSVPDGQFILDTVGQQLAFIEKTTSKTHENLNPKKHTTKKPQSSFSDKPSKTRVTNKHVHNTDKKCVIRDDTYNFTEEYFNEKPMKLYNASDYTEKKPSAKVNQLQQPKSVFGLSEDMFESTSTLDLISQQGLNLESVYLRNSSFEPDKWNQCLMTLKDVSVQSKSLNLDRSKNDCGKSWSR